MGKTDDEQVRQDLGITWARDSVTAKLIERNLDRPTLTSVAKQQSVTTPDVRQSFKLVAELARQLRQKEV